MEKYNSLQVHPSEDRHRVQVAAVRAGVRAGGGRHRRLPEGDHARVQRARAAHARPRARAHRQPGYQFLPLSLKCNDFSTLRYNMFPWWISNGLF
jgi:hypothetical protein